MDNKTRVIQLKDAWGLPGEIEKSDVEIVGIFEWALQSLGVWHDVLLGGHALNATPAFRQPGVQKVLNIFAVGETNLPETKRLRAARWLANTYYRKPIYQDLRENFPDLLRPRRSNELSPTSRFVWCGTTSRSSIGTFAGPTCRTLLTSFE